MDNGTQTEYRNVLRKAREYSDLGFTSRQVVTVVDYQPACLNRNVLFASLARRSWQDLMLDPVARFQKSDILIKNILINA